MVDEVLMSCPSSVTSEDENGPVQDDQIVTHVQSPVSGYVDQVFRSSTSRYFCGQGRSNSPFGTTICLCCNFNKECSSTHISTCTINSVLIHSRYHMHVMFGVMLLLLFL